MRCPGQESEIADLACLDDMARAVILMCVRDPAVRDEDWAISGMLVLDGQNCKRDKADLAIAPAAPLCKTFLIVEKEEPNAHRRILPSPQADP
jgi:hypothetical protein